ncbi:MAG TPA: class II aldolase/adducin family protein [Symbiobacteriaceae bacterium]|nr:class II aldolase/adducin family protein [Symbiobacteriaceae bacterium]
MVDAGDARGEVQKVEAELRRALVRAGRDLYRQGMMAGASGNLSARLDAHRLLITPSGAAKGRLRPGDLLVIDLEGNLVEGTGRPSAETAMHLAVYRTLPGVQAVAHAHPIKAGALSAAHLFIPVDTLPEALFALGDIPCVPFIPSATPALGMAVAAALQDADGALLFNHGAITVGTSVEAARMKMEILEALAETAIHTRLLGGGVPLPAAEVERLRAIWRQRRFQ